MRNRMRLAVAVGVGAVIACGSGVGAYAADHKAQRTSHVSFRLAQGVTGGHQWSLTVYGPNRDGDWCWRVLVQTTLNEDGCGLDRRNPNDPTSGSTDIARLDDSHDLYYGWAPKAATRVVLVAPATAATLSERGPDGTSPVAASAESSAGKPRVASLRAEPAGGPDGQSFAEVVPAGNWIAEYFNATGKRIDPYKP